MTCYVSNIIQCTYIYTGKVDVEKMTEEEREDWEMEQKRLDREWYGLDEGYDDDHNPFSGMSSDYTKRKEEEVEKKKKKKMTARQAQHQRVSIY